MTSRTSPWLILGAVGFMAPGCVQSALNPSDAVTLSGKAQHEDKSPLASAELALVRSDNSACVGTSAFAKPTTDAQGAFQVPMKGSDTQNGDVARCFRLSLPVGAQGAQLSADFLVQVTQVEVPTLQQWNGAPAASLTATGAQLTFVDLGSTHGLPGLDYSLTAQVGAAVAWASPHVVSPVAFSDALLEDFSATASVSASSPVKGSGTTFTLRYQCDGVALPTHAKVPASRGAACAYAGAPTVCPLTDGKVDKVALGSGVTDVTVTLPAAKLLKKAVLRGVGVSPSATVVLEGSPDGVTFSHLADVGALDAYQELDLTGATAITQVRLKGTRTDGGTFAVSSLDELSLFE